MVDIEDYCEMLSSRYDALMTSQQVSLTKHPFIVRKTKQNKTIYYD